jgi:hypothetical protein
VELPGGIAFQHDIRTGLSLEFGVCDVIYAEPPWPDGFETFNERAGTTGGTYRELMQAIAKAVLSDTKAPAVLLVGERAIKLLPPFLDHVKTILNGNEVWAISYRTRLPATPRTSEELVAWLATRFQCVGDFCCGYGKAGRIFYRAGKRFVLADYNARCIGHIAVHGKGWL